MGYLENVIIRTYPHLVKLDEMRNVGGSYSIEWERVNQEVIDKEFLDLMQIVQIRLDMGGIDGIHKLNSLRS